MQPATAQTEATRSGILTTLGATVGLAFGPSVIANLTVTAYITPIEQEFGWLRSDVSFAFSLVAYMIVVVSPLQGMLVDRFGPRRVVLTSIPLFALSLAAIYLTPGNIYVYYFLWALVPIAGLGLWPLGYLQAVTPWFDRKLGLALGCANAGIGVGSTFLPMLVIGPIIAAYSWRHAVLAIAFLVLFVSWPVVAYCLREPSAAEVAARKLTAAGKSFGLAFKQAMREPTFWMLNLGFFLLGVTATSLVTQQVPLLRDAGWTVDETTRLQTTFGFGLLFARVAVGFVIDHIFAPRVLTTVSIGGAVACVLYAMYPDLGYVSAILIGFLLGAEFDVLAFLIKRYYGNVAYGRIYGVIFGVFYLGSAVGIWGLPKLREASADLSYDNALYAAAGSCSLRRCSWRSCRSTVTPRATRRNPLPVRRPPKISNRPGAPMRFATTTLLAALLGTCTCFSAAAQVRNLRPVTDAMLQNPDPADWLSWRRTLNHWGYSPLTQVNARNVAQLRLVWTRPLAQGVQEGTPLVHDGVMFFPNPNDITQAIDAATGDLIWEYRRPVQEDNNDYIPFPSINRNLAIYGNLILDNGADNFAYALDARTGALAWETRFSTTAAAHSTARGRSSQTAKSFRAGAASRRVVPRRAC